MGSVMSIYLNRIVYFDKRITLFCLGDVVRSISNGCKPQSYQLPLDIGTGGRLVG